MRTVPSLFPRGDHLQEDEEGEEGQPSVSFSAHYSCTTVYRPGGGAVSVCIEREKGKRLKGTGWTRVLCHFTVENSSRVLSESP